MSYWVRSIDLAPTFYKWNYIPSYANRMRNISDDLLGLYEDITKNLDSWRVCGSDNMFTQEIAVWWTDDETSEVQKLSLIDLIPEYIFRVIYK